ncbi:MAG: TRAP transporter fused permease subunit [Alphaproteobacteria bacterium]|nr:TRAP transporter fused permease subunit [Alphaproteobacteria bacterium]
MRELKGSAGVAVSAWACAWAAIHVYWAGTGFPEPLTTRALHILAFLPPAFLLFPARAQSPGGRPSASDWVLAAVATVPPGYVWWNAEALNLRISQIDPVLPGEVVLGMLGVGLLLEAVRRAVAPVLALLSLVMIAYLLATEHMPGMLAYRDIPVPEIVEAMYLSGSQGIFGFVTGISATVVSAFIIFGAFIAATGSGRLFMNIGTRAAGRFAGGPAKVEVVTSALFGMISGSSTANVVSVGSFTIPSMIRRGYAPRFAAAVEAAASTGGQIMPPIMGAAAFIMAETTQIPYGEIIVAAALGAVLYYFCIFMTVHFQAKKDGLAGLAAGDLPAWREIGRDVHLLLPIVVMVVLLHAHFSANLAAFWSIVAMLACSWLRRHTRIGPWALLTTLAAGGKAVVTVALACTCANIVVTTLTMTGLTLSVGAAVMSLADGSMLVVGVLLMALVMLLGMGVPTSAAYVIGASIGAPILIKLGVPELAAHLFVFYFAVFADVTPPVAVASYAAAAIAGSDPMRAGASAFRLAMGGFIVGFGYLFTQALLLRAPWPEIVGNVVIDLAGLTMIAGAITGHFGRNVPPLARLLAFAAALALCLLHEVPLWYRVIASLACLVVVLVRYAAPSPQGDPLARRT